VLPNRYFHLVQRVMRGKVRKWLRHECPFLEVRPTEGARGDSLIFPAGLAG
jgi:hypothetical protein